LVDAQFAAAPGVEIDLPRSFAAKRLKLAIQPLDKLVTRQCHGQSSTT
jgi:hypothetical protein